MSAVARGQATATDSDRYGQCPLRTTTGTASHASARESSLPAMPANGSTQPPCSRYALKKGIASPEVQKLFDTQGAEALASSPEEFGAFLKNGSARFATIIRGAGISAD